jgi:hypothetical protein
VGRKKNDHGGGLTGICGCRCTLCVNKKIERRRQREHLVGHWVQKLDPEKVIEIKRLLYLGEKQYAIAEKYGLHQTTVSGINRGKRWRQVAYHPSRQDRRIRDRMRKADGKQAA